MALNKIRTQVFTEFEIKKMRMSVKKLESTWGFGYLKINHGVSWEVLVQGNAKIINRANRFDYETIEGNMKILNSF